MTVDMIRLKSFSMVINNATCEWNSLASLSTLDFIKALLDFDFIT